MQQASHWKKHNLNLHLIFELLILLNEQWSRDGCSPESRKVNHLWRTPESHKVNHLWRTESSLQVLNHCLESLGLGLTTKCLDLLLFGYVDLGLGPTTKCFDLLLFGYVVNSHHSDEEVLHECYLVLIHTQPLAQIHISVHAKCSQLQGAMGNLLTMHENSQCPK